MTKQRKRITEKLRAQLQQEIDSRCPVCADLDVGHFEVHHLDENPVNNEFTNLLMLCRGCHSNITKGDITLEEARGFKKMLTIRNSKKTNNISISGNIKDSAVANSINTLIIKTNKSPKTLPNNDAIEGDLDKKNYVKYLIDKYNECKEFELGKGNVKYPVIYSMIKKEFKASAYQVNINQFEHLCVFLQKRIDGTKRGKINKSKGWKNYCLFKTNPI